MKRSKTAGSLDSRILKRIRATKSASVFSAVQFLDFGTRAGIDQALSRLCKAGTLRRVARGLYDLPRSHPWFGTLSPGTAEMTAAAARKGGLELLPTGAEAANLLGLSEQVPAKAVYLTNGKSRKLKLDGQPVELKERSARLMAMSAKPTALIVSALKSLGKAHVTTERLARLHRDLPAEDKAILIKELPLAPAWTHPFLRYLATGRTSL